MEAKDKAKVLIAKAFVELRNSNDQKSYKAQNELAKVVKLLDEKPVAMAG